MRKLFYLNILILCSCAGNEGAKDMSGGQTKSHKELLYIECTVDGTNKTTQEVADSVQLWSHYHGDVYSGYVAHGEKVLAIRRQGDAIFVETQTGTRGWISYWHLKELKDHFSTE